MQPAFAAPTQRNTPRQPATASNGLQRIGPAASSVFNSRPPDLYRWLVRNRREIETELHERGRPRWNEIAAELTKNGFAKPGGAVLTAAYVRHTWWRVRLRFRIAVVREPTPVRAVPEGKPVVASGTKRTFGFPTARDRA